MEAFRTEIVQSSGIIIVSPEYNYSIPGRLKNAIDWASRGEHPPLLNKPISLMGASTGNWGTLRMQLSFLPIYQAMKMKPVYKPEVLIGLIQNKFDQNEKLTDETAKDIIRKNPAVLYKLMLE